MTWVNTGGCRSYRLDTDLLTQVWGSEGFDKALEDLKSKLRLNRQINRSECICKGEAGETVQSTERNPKWLGRAGTQLEKA